LIVSIPDILLKCLEIFKCCFSKPQFENFCFYVIGLILCLESRNIQDINKQLGRNKDQSSRNRFVRESPWLNRTLRRNRKKLISIAISNSKAKRKNISCYRCKRDKVIRYFRVPFIPYVLSILA
jgi:hypothetical protein